ncbi:MAG: YggS family pyridoxal phosphate-dependent enzyme [Pseudomonadales bacterium]|nr:YggS family pyridoxal phosphate-dependent enzyme [Pseudomonadales bacterium]
MDEQQLHDNIAKLLQRLRLEVQKCQRISEDIQLLAVSKTQPAEAIRSACQCGLRQFGESYVQEAMAKMAQLQDLPLCWHFIGPIQSNKARAIAEHFDWVHSVDRARVARRLSQYRPADKAPLQVCLQVNISGESSKAGVAPEALPQLVREVLPLPGLQLRGLMAIPAPSTDPATQRAAFAQVRTALLQLRALAPQLDTLSMGMSNDLEAAIAEGATILRVGSAIFGARNR